MPANMAEIILSKVSSFTGYAVDDFYAFRHWRATRPVIV